MCPVSSFQAALEGLRSCIPGGPPHVLLPREGYCRLAGDPEESLSSKSACTKAAQQQFLSLYSEAEKQIESYRNPRSAASFLSLFQSALNHHLSDLRTTLGSFRTASTATAINRIMALLDGTAVFDAVVTANKNLCQHYVLPPAEHYFSKISYDVYDPGEFEEGIGKLIAVFFVRHGYDLLPAVQALEKDANELLRDYQAAFQAMAQAEIERCILAPIQSKLPLLWEAEEGGRPA